MDWVTAFLQGPFYQLGILIWNGMLSLIGAVSTETPMSFSTATWGYVVFDIYPWTFAIGAVLLNTFFFIGFFRQASDLKQNFTMEVFVDCGIRVILGNALMVSGLSLMQLVFRMAAGLCGDLLLNEHISFAQEDLDVGSTIFFLCFGIVFFCVCLVCSGMIFLAVYGRFLQLYLLVVCAPFALSTLPGGQGVSSTCSAWLRTFLGKAFEIVLIALALVIGARMGGAISFGSHLLGAGSVFDGAVQTLQNMATMVLLAASVKGADSFMRRTFAL